MAIRLLRYDNDPILHKVARKVDEVDDKVIELIEDMFETMEVNNGIGLAAPQVGISKRILILNLDGMDGYTSEDKYVLINPEILEEAGEQIQEEGCLSFPNIFGKVRRAEYIKVKALNKDGEEYVLEGEGLLAQAIAHEIDHLNGIVFIDKVEPNTLWKEEEIDESE